jgi:ATP-dependent DNA helicase RecQ
LSLSAIGLSSCSTRAGLCYQLPAVVIGGVTIVVSPLIALMRDQVDSLTKKGVSAACISSANKDYENSRVLEAVIGRKLNTTKRKGDEVGRKPISILYVTPESLQTQKFQSILNELYQSNRLAGFAIDECHCLSTWGHDFRPAYRKLDVLRTQFPVVPCMALTATATPAVLADIKKTLKLQDAPCLVGSFDRPNIVYKVHYKDGLDALKPLGALLDVAKFISKQHRRAKQSNRPCSGLVYVHKQTDTAFLSREIQQRTGIRAVAYHGGMKPDERTASQNVWTSGEAPIAVATCAMGMGIDLPHIRYVIHWSIPKTMDGFYQVRLLKCSGWCMKCRT